MDPNDFVSLPFGVQTALGAGYLAYVVAYAGLRRDHTALDALFITLAFGLIPWVGFFLVGPQSPIAGLTVGVLLALAAAIAWRGRLRDWWRLVMRYGHVHLDEGTYAAWTSFIQTTRRMGQIDVHTRDGRVLRCLNLKTYEQAHLGGTFLGNDGAVVLVVDQEDSPEGERQEMTNITDPDWGTRMTYVPAGEIIRVDLRIE